MRLRVFPAILIVLGVTLLLGNLEIVPKEAIRHFVHVWWPLLLVGLGGAMLLMPRGLLPPPSLQAAARRAAGSSRPGLTPGVRYRGRRVGLPRGGLVLSPRSAIAPRRQPINPVFPRPLRIRGKAVARPHRLQ